MTGYRDSWSPKVLGAGVSGGGEDRRGISAESHTQTSRQAGGTSRGRRKTFSESLL